MSDSKRDWKFKKQDSSQNEPISDDSDLDFDDFQVVDEVDEAESRIETKRNVYDSNSRARSENIPSSSNNFKNDTERKDYKDKFVPKKDTIGEKIPEESKKCNKDVFRSRHTALGVASYLQHLKENPVKKEIKIDESEKDVQEQQKKSPHRTVHGQAREYNGSVRYAKGQIKKSRSPVRRANSSNRGQKRLIKGSRSPNRGKKSPMMGSRSPYNDTIPQEVKHPIKNFRSPHKEGKYPNTKQYVSPVRDRNPIRQSWDPFRYDRSPSTSPVRVVRYGSPDEPRYNSHGSENKFSYHSPPAVTYPSYNSRYSASEDIASEQRYPNRNYPERYSPNRNYPERYSPIGERSPLRQSPDRIPFHRSRSPSNYDKNRSPSSHRNFEKGSPCRYVQQGRPDLSQERHNLTGSLERFNPSRGRSPQRRISNERIERFSPPISRSPYRKISKERFERDERSSPTRKRSPYGHTSREIMGRKLNTERVEGYSPPRGKSPVRQMNMEHFGRFCPPEERSPHRKMSLERAGRYSPARGRSPSRQKDKDRLQRFSPFIQSSQRHLSKDRIERFSPPIDRSPSHPNKNISGRYSPSKSCHFQSQSNNERLGQFNHHRNGSPKRRTSKDRIERVTPSRMRSPKRSNNDRINKLSPHRNRSPPRKSGKERLERFSPSRIRSPQLYKKHIKSPRRRKLRSSEERSYIHKDRSNTRSPYRDREENQSPFEPSSKKRKSGISRRSRSVSPERNMRNETTQQALDDMKKIHERECQRYRETPSAHPDYNVEYRKFCEAKTRRVLELGGDPACYDFVSEWNTYWPKRMSELFRESWLKMKEHSLKLMLEKSQKKQMKMLSKTQVYSYTAKNINEASPNMEHNKKNDEIISSHFKGRERQQRE
ncbi:unnamed protein product, partial [Meganyctiphanes norvegica]